MKVVKRKIIKFYTSVFFLSIIILLFDFFNNEYEKNREISLQPVTVNLLAKVHPNLSWFFKPLNPKLIIKPGEVTTVEYLVENLGNEASTGIATFQYYPKQYGTYISKINCFCYDAKTLKAKEKSKYSLIMLIDPEVTKDSKTKNVKEITIQFTFFNYDEHKKKEN